jgi:dihydrodipicolinate synthase/N-acetylneuraminate lyase
MLKGVISPSIVLFHEDGSVDYEKSVAHMAWMLEAGVNGLFVTGTYGSGYLLSLEERVKLCRLAQELTEKHAGTFVIAHTGCIDTASSVALTKKVYDLGIGAVSAISPLIYDYTESDIKRYYDTLLGAADLAVYAYNNPGLTGYALSLELIEELKALGLSGIKDSSADLGLAAHFCADKEQTFQYITGTASGWLGMREAGVMAMIAGMSNYLPEFVVALYKTSYSDPAACKAVNEIIKSVGSKLKFGNSLVSSHITLKARGLAAGHMRLPLYVDYEGNAEGIARGRAAVEEAFDAYNLL